MHERVNIANCTLSSWLEGYNIFQCKFYCTIGKDIIQSFPKSYFYWTRYKCGQSMSEIVEHDCFSWEGFNNIFWFIWSNQFNYNFVNYLQASTPPGNIYLFKVNNRNIRKKCEICSKLTMKNDVVLTLNICHTFF